jgi:CubicO group peptidase (beta-lactamase class C family)
MSTIILALLLQAVAVDSLEREHVKGVIGARLDSQLTRFAAEGFSGAVLVVRDRRVVLLKGYGLADRERGVRNSAATRFEMNSMTKMLTGVSILQLAAAGRLRVDDPIGRHLGEFPTAKRGATIEQLAAHTAGLIMQGANLAGDSRDAFVADVKRTPRESAPGSAYRYTNAGYSLLAATIEHATGDSFEAYLRRNAFAPAGMQTARFRDEVPSDDTLFARGYVAGTSGAQRGPPNPYIWGTRGAGGVWSTVGDMYRWIVAVEDGRVLPSSQRARLFSVPTPPSQEMYGWHVYPATDSSRTRIDKGGGSADFASQLLYYPDERVVVVWASNDLTRRWRQELNRAIPDILFTNSK